MLYFCILPLSEGEVFSAFILHDFILSSNFCTSSNPSVLKLIHGMVNAQHSCQLFHPIFNKQITDSIDLVSFFVSNSSFGKISRECSCRYLNADPILRLCIREDKILSVYFYRLKNKHSFLICRPF